MRREFIFSGLFCVLMFVTFGSSAYTCKNKQTGQEMVSGSSSVTVPLNRIITAGETVFFDLGEYYQCKNTTPNEYDDFMFIQNNGLSTVLGKDFEVGAYIRGGRYSIPVPYTNILTLPRKGDGDWHDLPVRVFFRVGENPGKEIKISKGSKIAEIQLYKYAYWNGSTSKQDEKYFQWDIIAGNDSVFTSGTCNINSGSDIQINFGQIPYQKLTSLGLSSSYRRNVYVPYQCKNPVSMPIKITLSAESASFSQDAIQLSNENLGVQMYYENKLVKPNDSIHTELKSGVGGNRFEFIVVKKNNSNVNAGQFTGSAILVMSAD